MQRYDADVLYEFAERLYAQAKLIIVMGTLLGMLPGGACAYLLVEHNGIIASLGALFGGVVGYVIGHEIAFILKLRAQIVLCQVQIEKNTRNEVGLETRPLSRY
jgi:hypothetical protein